MKKPQTRSNLVIKGNDFINARHQLSVAEMRIVLTMIAQIQRDDVGFKPYRIYIKDFVDAVGTSHKGEYERAREITSNLMKRVMEIPKETGYLQISFLSSAEYFRGTGYVELSFDPKLKPYLLQLKERFTQYDIRNVLSLQSFYSIRIYELLRQYSRIGERVMAVDELKEILKLPASYNHYASFKRRIVLQAQRDLAKHTDLSFTFEERKTSRKITHIRFIIKSVRSADKEEFPAAEVPEVVPAFDELPGDNALIEQLIAEFGLTRRQANAVIKAHESSYITENLAIVTERFEAGKVKELTPYTLKALAEDFRKTTTVIERRRHQNQLAKVREQQQQEEMTLAQEQRRLDFEKARDHELKRLREHISPEDQFDGFADYLKDVNKFALDFVKKEVTKQGRAFEVADQLEHRLIAPIFKDYLTKTYLPDTFSSFESWLQESHP